MTRGLVRPTTADEAIERAQSLLYLKPNPPGPFEPLPIGYQLGKGGTDPYRPHPGQWSVDRRRFVCDCSALTAWSWGYDRFQPERFPEGWINTDSMLKDATRRGEWFEEIPAPEIGAIVVYGRAGQMPGHTGLVVGVPAEWGPSWDLLRVIHCSASNARAIGGSAIRETSGKIWRKRGKILRYRIAAA